MLEIGSAITTATGNRTYNGWRNTDVSWGSIGPVAYTLAADMDHSINRAYGIQSEGGDSYYPAGVDMRATKWSMTSR